MTAKITHFIEYKEAFPENLNHKISIYSMEVKKVEHSEVALHGAVWN